MSAKLFLGAADLIDDKMIIGGSIIYMLLLLLGLILGLMALFMPFMVLRILQIQKLQLAALRHQGKALEAINANLISISQQINHFGSGQLMPRVHAPAPSARVEAPKTGLRR